VMFTMLSKYLYFIRFGSVTPLSVFSKLKVL